MCRRRNLRVVLDANRHKDGPHHAAPAIVIVGIGSEPESQAEESSDSRKDQKLDHGVPMTANKLAVLASSCVAKEAVTPTCWGKALAKALAGILGHAGLQLFAKFGVIEVFADQYDLVLAFGAGPFGIVDREALAGEVEHVAPLAFVEPQNSFGSKYRSGHQIVEKVLELAQGKGTFGRK